MKTKKTGNLKLSKINAPKITPDTQNFNFKTMWHPEFITCREAEVSDVVALINAHIALYGRRVLEPNTSQFNKLIRKCCGTENLRTKRIQPALEELNLELVDLPKFASLHQLKTHLVGLLKENNLILYPVCHADTNTFFDILIVDHCRMLYEVPPELQGPIDGDDLFIAPNSTQNICTWDNLTHQLIPGKPSAEDVRLLNTPKGLSSLGRFCIANTKIVRKKILDYEK